MDKILHGDSLELLKDMEDNTIDSIVTDPPYGYSFMGKDWDKAVPSVELWEECLRVLKPGGFAFIMSAPRADVQSEMIKRLEQAGFRVDFTPIYWTYATGFPKAANMGKLVDKRLGVEREVVGKKECGYQVSISKTRKEQGYRPNETNATTEVDITIPGSDEAKALDGSYAGYQPKPAVEVVIVVMKPLSEKSFLNQAMKNGKGVTWLDDMRIPFKSDDNLKRHENDYERVSAFGDVSESETKDGRNLWGKKATKKVKITNRKPRPEDEASPLGRFAANLLVQDDVLNTEEDEFTRYFDMDAWWEDRKQKLPSNIQATYPFMIVPKASKGEKNKGMENFETKQSSGGGGGIGDYKDDVNSASGKYGSEKAPAKNFHPTVKPISLMSYLVTMGSRENDLVLDPFVGSGTTCIAAKLLNRKYLGMELNDEYAVIAQERIKAHKPEKQEHNFF